MTQCGRRSPRGAVRRRQGWRWRSDASGARTRGSALTRAAADSSMAMYFGFTLVWPEMSYLVRSGWVIVLSFTAVAMPTMRRNGWRIPFRDLIAAPDRGVARLGAGLLDCRGGENRGTKVLNTVGPRRLPKTTANRGFVPHPSRFVPDSPASQDFCPRRGATPRWAQSVFARDPDGRSWPRRAAGKKYLPPARQAAGCDRPRIRTLV